MGLISKEEVLKRIEYHQSNKVINRIKTTYAFELLKSDIEEIEEIVTCEKCKWGDMGIDEEGKPFWKCIGIHYGGTKPTDFCSYGERRE